MEYAKIPKNINAPSNVKASWNKAANVEVRR